MSKEQNHAQQNAEGHAESMLDMYRAFRLLEDGGRSVELDGDEYTDADAIREQAQETALDVSVRGPWHTPGDKDGMKPDAFRILLTTGGPALQLVGELNEHGEPDADSAGFEIQDWGTPWTEYRPAADAQDDWSEALTWFLGCFYFGG